MNWYLAKLVFRVVCGDGCHTPQFDEQLRLMYAEDELHAFHKARLSGETGFISCISEEAVKVKWEFIDIIELHCLTQFTDGAEIYSSVKEEPDAERYIRSVRKTAARLLQDSLISLPV